MVDDHQMVLESIRDALSARDSMLVVGAVASLDAARRLLQSVAVDVVITDLQLGDGHGTELVAVCEALNPAPQVLLITGTDERLAVTEALAAGCAGLVSKSHGVDRLVAAVVAIAQGGSVFPAEFLRQAVDGNGNASSTLTVREMEVLRELAGARSAREIADGLFLSEHTVRNHISQVLAKLGARNQLEAVVLAARSGLVTLT